MNILFCIDPGPDSSGWALLKKADEDNPGLFEEKYEVLEHGVFPNDLIKKEMRRFSGTFKSVVIERIQSYGKAVGDTTFDTCIQVGRFAEYAETVLQDEVFLIKRQIVKMHLCGAGNVKKSEVQQAAKNCFEPSGGGKDPYKGIKSKPGPLYNCTNHTLDAIALGITQFRIEEIEKNGTRS